MAPIASGPHARTHYERAAVSKVWVATRTSALFASQLLLVRRALVGTAHSDMRCNERSLLYSLLTALHPRALWAGSDLHAEHGEAPAEGAVRPGVAARDRPRHLHGMSWHCMVWQVEILSVSN